MIIEMAADLVQGGWDALWNITSGIGKGAGSVISGVGGIFFPTSQKTTIQSEITEAAGFENAYRDISVDAPSVWETNWYSKSDWLEGPYAEQFAVLTKIKESTALNEMVSGTKQDPIGDMFANIMGALEGAGEISGRVATIADRIVGPWVPREVIKGKPDAGFPEGRNEQHSSNLSNKGAQVVDIFKTGMQGIYDQVRGLFNIGYPQPAPQPVPNIRTEITPSGISTGMLLIGGLIVLVILLGKKK